MNINEIKKECEEIKNIKLNLQKKDLINEVRKKKIKEKKEKMILHMNQIQKEINELNDKISKNYSRYIANNNICTEEIFLKLKKIEILVENKQNYFKEKKKEIIEREKKLNENIKNLSKEKLEIYNKMISCEKEKSKIYFLRSIQKNNILYEKMKNSFEIRTIFDEILKNSGIQIELNKEKKLQKVCYNIFLLIQKFFNYLVQLRKCFQ